MKCDDNKVLTSVYLLTNALNRKEQLKAILLLMSWYFRGDNDD